MIQPKSNQNFLILNPQNREQDKSKINDKQLNEKLAESCWIRITSQIKYQKLDLIINLVSHINNHIISKLTVTPK